MAGMKNDLMFDLFDPKDLPARPVTREMIQEAHEALVRNTGMPWVDYQPSTKARTLAEAHDLIKRTRAKGSP